MKNLLKFLKNSTKKNTTPNKILQNSISDSERPKKKDRKDKSHQKSLSPLSKRMAIMSENIQSRDGGSYQYNQGYENVPSGSGGNLDDYEMKVNNFHSQIKQIYCHTVHFD
jgi:hypothetical protein